ncbi:MAG TPA: hypothetical protein VH682_24570 [Gemmataceae bacterium]|jgi:hypothetical protein
MARPKHIDDPAPAVLGGPFIIDPSAAYKPAEVIAGLGLRASSLRSEWRAGRLVIRRRCGRNFILGADLLAWLTADDAELASPRRRPRASEPAA